MSENYYTILGVDEKSTKDEIKKAYRGLQMKYHPDRNQGNKDCINMTQKINEAYETLSDEQKRREYNVIRNNPFMKMGSNGNMNMNMNMNNANIPLNDIFNMMFGGNFQNGAKVHIFHGGNMNVQNALNKPVPLMKSLQINMSQVFTGVSLPLEVERWTMENNTKVFEKETIYVDIPPGIDNNEMIVLRDKGNIISENCKGDVKVNILVQNNTAFKRSGLDLILDKKITLKDALCGFTFNLDYINGKNYTLNNNKGSIVPPEYKKMYPGMGLKRGEHKGNMIIQFHVEFPEKLSIEQIDKLSEIL
jgi:DnaJ-class molecular chaperone